MKQTARKALRATFADLKAGGLKDIKFFLAHTSEATTEQVCADVNLFLGAIREGKRRPLEWNDSGGVRPAAA